MKKIVLAPYNGNSSLATTQTLKDIIKFSSEIGFSPLYVPPRSGILSSFQYYLKKIQALTADVLLIPYPAIANPIKTIKLRSLDNSVLKFLSRNISSLIIYVYDLPIDQIWHTRPSSWQSLLDSLSFSLEAELFEVADKVLVFNKEMAKKIKERSGMSNKKFVYYEILDMGVNFRISHTNIKNNKKKRVVAYAGNLSQERIHGFEEYFRRLPAGFEVWLIGPNGEWIGREFDSRVHYFGALFDSAFYSTLSKADFGVIWYPPNLSGYLRISSSSKFSSYMVAGIPVLVDSHAKYVAEVVKKYKVGIVGKDLEELLFKARHIDEDIYNMLGHNVVSLANKIRNGYFIKKALITATGGL